jgi:hypothetical protein
MMHIVLMNQSSSLTMPRAVVGSKAGRPYTAYLVSVARVRMKAGPAIYQMHAWFRAPGLTYDLMHASARGRCWIGACNSSAYHDIHHQLYGNKYNFSQPFFVMWDKILGTYMPYTLEEGKGGGLEARPVNLSLAAQSKSD